MGNKNGKVEEEEMSEVQEKRKENDERSRSTEEMLKQEPMKETPKMTKDDFELLKTVGKGSFGKVFQVRKRRIGDDIGTI